MTKKYKFLHFFHQHFWDTLKEILIYLMWKENKNNGVGQTLNCCPKNDWSWNRLIFFLYVLSYFLIKSFLPLFLSVSFLIFLSVCFLFFMKCYVRLFFQCFLPRFLVFSVFLSSFIQKLPSFWEFSFLFFWEYLSLFVFFFWEREFPSYFFSENFPSSVCSVFRSLFFVSFLHNFL